MAKAVFIGSSRGSMIGPKVRDQNSIDLYSGRSAEAIYFASERASMREFSSREDRRSPRRQQKAAAQVKNNK